MLERGDLELLIYISRTFRKIGKQWVQVGVIGNGVMGLKMDVVLLLLWGITTLYNSKVI